MKKSPLRLTQHKKFVPNGTHPNFRFAKTSFMQESLYAIRKPAFHRKETVNYDGVLPSFNFIEER